ncbi:MAG: glycosyltransferase [Aquificaceae bacterium]
MKLVDITPYFHSKSGGIRRYILEKVKYLEGKDIEHVLIIPGKEKKVYRIWSTKVYQIPSFPIPMSGGYRFFGSFKDIKEILRMEKPNVVELGGTYIPITHLRSQRYKLIVFYHADVRTDASLLPIPEKLKEKLINFTLTKKLSFADFIITPSTRQEEFLKQNGFEKVQTVNLGVDTHVFNTSTRDHRLSRMLGIMDHTFKVIYAGRLSPEKGIDILLDVIDIMDPSLFYFLIAGDGPLKGKVERFAQRRPNVSYLGYIQNEEELSRIYASCDIYISASTSETYGLSFLEAQACGCLLVAPDLGLETQPFKDFLVKTPDTESFYDALIRAANAQSFLMREKVSSHIKENFSWERCFEKLLEVYSLVDEQVFKIESG